MQKSKKNIISIICCALASILLFCYICVVLIPKSDSDMFAARVFQGKGFVNEPENSLDIMFFGNSDAYAGIIPNKIYGEHGYTSYVCGKSLQTIENANKMLIEAYKTQTPKIVVLETDCLYEEKAIDVDESNLFLSPFIYHCRWKEVKKRDFLCLPLKTSRIDIAKGYNKSDTVYNCKSTNYMGNETDKPLPISSKSMFALKEFIKNCEENSSKVIFLELPSPISWNYAKHNYVKSLADELSIPFIDLNVPKEGFSLDFTKDFRDNGDHLNHSGALKATEYISGFLNRNYSDILLDKRSLDCYDTWDKNAQEYFDKRI